MYKLPEKTYFHILTRFPCAGNAFCLYEVGVVQLQGVLTAGSLSNQETVKFKDMSLKNILQHTRNGLQRSIRIL